jgi:topoisomerase-4 subunit B
MTEVYTAHSIEVLQGLDPVKRRPGMYTDTSRPNHLAQEVIDNSVDEALAGFATEIQVILHEDDSLQVIDDGRGMPVDTHPELGLCGIEVILTKLHAGGKFSNKNYAFSGGLHGVGVSVVNALSSRIDVEVKRQGLVYAMSFAHGDKITELQEIGTARKRETGTSIRFWPHPDYFDHPKIAIKPLMQLLQAKAVLCQGLKVSFDQKATGEHHEWHYNQGLIDYLIQSIPPHTPRDFLFFDQFKTEQGEVEWALCWDFDQTLAFTESYVNLIPTAQGGTHVMGLRQGLWDAFLAFCELRNLIPRGLKTTADDLWDACHYVLSIKIQEPQFAGQLKEKLTSKSASLLVNSVIKDSFSLWLNEHRSTGEALAQAVIERAQQRLRKQKAVTRKSITQGPALPGKLSDCLEQDLARSELFLVEGDSAGGSAKQARNKDFQAILPLRGKILNTWEVSSDQALQSQEIRDISIALGVEPGSDDLSQLRYGKICILADADSDGAHIATLLCALFLKHYQALVKNGHIYIATPPLYRIDAGKQVHYALDEADKTSVLEHLQAQGLSKVNVQRFKGLGEMNPLQLRETTMDPNSRRLIQLTIDNEHHCHHMMDMMLSKKRAHDRKQWLEKKGNLAQI